MGAVSRQLLYSMYIPCVTVCILPRGYKKRGGTSDFWGPEIFSLTSHLIFQKSKDVSAQRPQRNITLGRLIS
jgi:hypothetical protein